MSSSLYLYNKTSRELIGDVIIGLVLASVVVSIGAGLFFLIAANYPPSALGVFNQAYAVLIVSGQLSTLGLQNAVLFHLPLLLGQKEQAGKVLCTALFLILVGGICTSASVFILAGAISELFDSPGLGRALELMAPAVLFFAVNKALLNAFNGLQFMRSYNVLAASRIGLMVLFVIILIYFDMPGETLSLVFVFTEGILCVVLLRLAYARGYLLTVRPDRKAGGTLLSFGVRSIGVGILHELNTRIDILMLGYFLVDTAVGLYTFPAVLVESILLLMYSIRRNVDPIVTRLLALAEYGALRNFIYACLKYGLTGSVALSVFVAAAYPLVLYLFPIFGSYANSNFLLWTLLSGASVWGGFVVVSGALIQIGRPGQQTLLILIQVVLNVGLNAILIPAHGLIGAALATTATMLSTSVFFFFLLRRLSDLQHLAR